MTLRKTAAKATLAGALTVAALGLGTGLAQAGPPGPPPPPWPIPSPDGPGANFAGPGNPLPPGQGYLPPPGHTGFAAQQDLVAPDWAPPAPPPPTWAPWLPVVWNWDAKAWGVMWNGGFQPL
ncbi:MAG TPA: hypothetical protein VE666_10260 [Mycobacterium sp.]|nr:hypothetical protein [Mycobacterium sp.]